MFGPTSSSDLGWTLVVRYLYIYTMQLQCIKKGAQFLINIVRDAESKERPNTVCGRDTVRTNCSSKICTKLIFWPGKSTSPAAHDGAGKPGSK